MADQGDSDADEGQEVLGPAKSSQATGRRQLQKYVAELEDMTGQSWAGHLDTYKRFG